jgi:quercetin dioxygenase-like cupin family protein
VCRGEATPTMKWRRGPRPRFRRCCVSGVCPHSTTGMEIKRIGSQPSGKGPADWFTGTVRIDPLFDRPEPARVSGASVTFEPGARTAWHTHPLGQTLIVTAGCGWAQREGGPVEEIRPGDVIWFPPGEKHWHGATATTAMTHIAIQEKLDGKAVDWMEKVSDEQYTPDQTKAPRPGRNRTQRPPRQKVGVQRGRTGRGIRRHSAIGSVRSHDHCRSQPHRHARSRCLLRPADAAQLAPFATLSATRTDCVNSRRSAMGLVWTLIG